MAMDELLDIFASTVGKRTVFRDMVEERFRELGIKAELGDFGRGPAMIGVWTVRSYRSGGMKQERIHLPKDMLPYGADAYDAILKHMTAL